MLNRPLKLLQINSDLSVLLSVPCAGNRKLYFLLLDVNRLIRLCRRVHSRQPIHVTASVLVVCVHLSKSSSEDVGFCFCVSTYFLCCGKTKVVSHQVLFFFLFLYHNGMFPRKAPLTSCHQNKLKWPYFVLIALALSWFRIH